MNSVNRDQLAEFLATELQLDRIRDYCPNGLQVEGKSEIRHLVTGVTASLALLEQAAACGADAVMVHHGYFWRNEDARLIGPKFRRIRLLIESGMNLFAYHLPLDVHPQIGNNACLGQQLGLLADGRFGDNDLGWLGQAPGLQTVAHLSERVGQVLQREPLLIGQPEQPLGRVAWCTGAAHTMLDQAIAAGASVFISGEISEPVVHLAREAGVAYLACGHHATERYGIQALGELVSRQFGLRHSFIDIPNPV